MTVFLFITINLMVVYLRPEAPLWQGVLLATIIWFPLYLLIEKRRKSSQDGRNTPPQPSGDEDRE